MDTAHLLCHVPLMKSLHLPLQYFIPGRQVTVPVTLQYFIPGRQVTVPDKLMKEFAGLRGDFASLLVSYEEELSKSSEVKERFVVYVRKLFRLGMSSCHDFKSTYDKLAGIYVSIFNIFYLKKICSALELPQNIR